MYTYNNDRLFNYPPKVKRSKVTNRRIVNYTENIFGIRSKNANTPLVYFTLTKKKRLPLSFFRCQFRLADQLYEKCESRQGLHRLMLDARLLAYGNRHDLENRSTQNDVVHDQFLHPSVHLDQAYDLVFNGKGFRITDCNSSKIVTCHEKRYKTLRHLSDLLRKRLTTND